VAPISWTGLGCYKEDGLYPDDDYRREKRALEEKLANLVVPGVDAAREAGQLLESLPTLWGEADLTERRKLLLTMLNAVYVDTVDEKAIVAIRPKPAFQPLFEIATTREGSEVVLINEPPEASNEPEAADSCFGGDGGGSNSPSRRFPDRMYYRLVRRFVSRLRELPPTESPLGQPNCL